MPSAAGQTYTTPSLGYKLEPAVDPQGRPLFGKDGERLNMKVVEDSEKEHVLNAFRLFGIHHWSSGRIARLFNEGTVAGMQAWQPGSIRDLCGGTPTSASRSTRRTYQLRDPETGKVTIKQRARKDWRRASVETSSDRAMGAVENGSEATPSVSRGIYEKQAAEDGRIVTDDLYPNVLIRPVCGSCGNRLILGRSGKYASFFCINGTHGMHGCGLKGYKSVGIVETAVLDVLKNRLFIPSSSRSC